jgi:hypothetical protein
LEQVEPLSTSKLQADASKPSDGVKDIVGIDSGTPQRIAAVIDRIFGERAKPARLVPLGDVLIQAKFSRR